MTLDNIVIDIDKKKVSCGLSFVACSRVSGLLFDPPFTFQQLANLCNSQRQTP